MLKKQLKENCVFFFFQEHGKSEITIINPAQFPDKHSVSEYLEPTVLGTIITPQEYIGKIIVLCQVGILRHAVLVIVTCIFKFTYT